MSGLLAIMLILSLLHMVAIKGELFVPEEISDSALNEDGVAAKGNDSDESADPFASAEGPEAKNSSGLLDDARKAQEDSLLTKEDEAQEHDGQQSMGHSNKDTHVSIQTLKPGQVPKPGVPYWTEVYVDKKMKSVLVNVKTVTIIESINSTSKSKYPTTASSRIVDPYIKIQMPSAPASSPASKGSKTSRSMSSSSKTVSSTRSVSRHQDSVSFTPLKKQAKSMIYGPSKRQQSATSTKSSSAKSSAKLVASTIARSSKPSSITAKKEEAESANSLGSIFNVLKDMPYGGKSSESIYIEGTFNFPKKKSLDGKSFKMNGYISTV